MLRSGPTALVRLLKACTLLLYLLLLGLLVIFGAFAFKEYYIPKAQRGEFGADLRLLRSYYMPPQTSGESNFIIDMLKFGHFAEFLRIQGLTNNHALFVLSHGRALPKSMPNRYAYYPDEGVLRSSTTPYFSARDLAQVLGPENAAQIHNLVMSGCNREGVFDLEEVKKYFPQATNITHTPAGKNGFEFVYRHALLYPREGNKAMYKPIDKLPADDSHHASDGNRQARPSPYVAEIYKPGQDKPFTNVIAGRELLEPPPANVMASSRYPLPLSTIFANATAGLEKKTPVAPPVSQPKALILLPSGKHPSSAAILFSLEPPALIRRLLNFPFLGIWRGPILSGLQAVCFLLLGLRLLMLGISKEG